MVPSPTHLLTTRPTVNVRRPCSWWECGLAVSFMKSAMASRLPTNPTNSRGYSRGTLCITPIRHSCSHQVLVWIAPSGRDTVSTKGWIYLCLWRLCWLTFALNGWINSRLLLFLVCLCSLSRTSPLGREVGNCRWGRSVTHVTEDSLSGGVLAREVTWSCPPT